MEDFLRVTDPEQQAKYRGYIKSRHIDFMLCDKDLYLLAGLELDDASHNDPAAKKTDAFKNSVFQQIGLPLYRISVGKNYNKAIDQLIKDLKKQL